ncbi:translation initiation factor [bacterium]|nr:translation initiation factor [bacterium]
MADARKKPIKLEFNTQLISSESPDSVAVQVRGSEGVNSENKGFSGTGILTQPITGSVKLRREVKGRAGKPVSILYGFDDPAAASDVNLKNLQSKLKETLACGGTFDTTEQEIVLQVDDLTRVRKTLEKLGFKVKG